MVCPKCGTTVNDNAVICVKCENILNNKSGFKTASFVLGILALVFATITTIITLLLVNRMTFFLELINFLLKNDNIIARFIFSILYLFLPLVISTCGIIFAILSKNNYKTKEIILNTIAITLCIVQIIIIMTI